MSLKVAVMIVLLGLLESVAAMAQTVPPPTQERLLFLMPAGEWEAGVVQQAANVTMTEYVPKGQTLQAWSRMTTTQTVTGTKATAEQFLSVMFNGFKARARCENGDAKAFRSEPANGYPSVLGVLICPTYKGATFGEYTMIKVIGGQDAVHVIQRAWRGPAYASGATMPFSAEEGREWIDYLGKISVCDPRDPAHPCPAAP